MPFSVQEIQTSRFNVKGEECQAPIPFADILSTNIEPLHCNSSTSDVYLPASGKIIEQYKYFMPVFMLMIQRGQSSDFIWKLVVVLADCNLKSNSSVFEFQLSNSLGLAIFIPDCTTNTGGKCVLRVYLLYFVSGVTVDQLCQHSGHCLNVGNTHHCQCQVGYTGSYCEVQLDECDSSPCQNGATCRDHLGGYQCEVMHSGLVGRGVNI